MANKQAVAQYYTAKGGAIVSSNHFKGSPAYLKGEILALNDIVGALCKSLGIDPLDVLGESAGNAAGTASPPPAPVAPPPPPPPPAPVAPVAPAPATDGGPLG